MQGKIKYFNAIKGFGFITNEESKDYFFHISSLQSDDSPDIGSRVNFSPSKNDKGLVAENVSFLKTNHPFLSVKGSAIKKSNIKNYGISSEYRYYQRVYVLNKEIIPYRNKVEKIVNSLFFGEHSYEYTKIKKIYRITQSRFNEIVSGTKSFRHVIFAQKGFPIGWEIIRSANSKETREIIAPHDGYFDLNSNEFFWELDEKNETISKEDVLRRLESYIYITTYQGDNFKFFANEFNNSLEEQLSHIKFELSK